MVHYNFDLQYTSENINYNLFLPTKILKKKKKNLLVYCLDNKEQLSWNRHSRLCIFLLKTLDIIFLMSIKEDFIENAV